MCLNGFLEFFRNRTAVVLLEVLHCDCRQERKFQHEEKKEKLYWLQAVVLGSAEEREAKRKLAEQHQSPTSDPPHRQQPLKELQ